MKYRLIFLATVAAMLTGVVFLQNYESKPNRYHQHLENEPYTPCTDHGDEIFCTHLPLFNIVTDAPIPDPFLYDENGEILRNKGMSLVTNEEMVSASVKFFTNPDGNNHLTDAPDFFERGLIRIRGHSSRRFDKKGYLLKFTTEDGVDGLNLSLDGMTADNSWVLHGPILDKTLLRNYLCYNISGEIMEFVPNVRFCELFLNGEYQGVYVLTEKIQFNEAGRCNLTKTDPRIAQTSFILRLDTGLTDPEHQLKTFFDYAGKRGLSNRQYEHFEIVYPNDTLTQDQKQYIALEISQLEKAIISFDSSDPKQGYMAYLDVDSFVDFLVLNEFMMNADAGRLSTYFCKDLRGKIKIIGWDYNNVFNNYFADFLEIDEIYSTNKWYACLMRDKQFVDRVVERYHELRRSILSDEYLCEYIDQTVEYLGPAIDRNYSRWGYTFTREYNEQNDRIVLSPVERNPSDYDEAIAQLTDAIEIHGRFLDENIESWYARCHKSTNKQFQYQGGN